MTMYVLKSVSWLCMFVCSDILLASVHLYVRRTAAIDHHKEGYDRVASGWLRVSNGLFNFSS